MDRGRIVRVLIFSDLNEGLSMTSALNDQSLGQIFRSARTRNGWTDRRVKEDTVREIYDLMKWGRTSANSGPARFVWVRSADAKATAEPVQGG